MIQAHRHRKTKVHRLFFDPSHLFCPFREAGIQLQSETGEPCCDATADPHTLANAARNAFQRKRKEMASKKPKSARNVFNKEERKIKAFLAAASCYPTENVQLQSLMNRALKAPCNAKTRKPRSYM